MSSTTLTQSSFQQTFNDIRQQIQSSPALKFFMLAGVAMLIFSMAPETMAGSTGAEFKPAWDKFVELIGGFGGKMIAGVSLAIALVGSALRFNPYLVFGSLGTGITAAFGTTVLDKVVGALI